MQILRWASRVLDFCYPWECGACQNPYEGASPLCETCLQKLSELETAPFCPACAMPLTQSGAPCPYCKGKGVPHYERLVRLGIFDDPLKTIIYQIKYHNRWSLAEHLAERMWRHAPIREVLERVDCLVAVPLHPLREIHRGYNQAQLIAARLARRSERRLIKPLVRLRNTSSQTRLPSRARRDANLKDAFGLINASVVRGKKIAVVDDVTTSGATLQSVARTLKLGNPAEIYAIVAAIADPKHYDFQMI